MTTFNNEVIYFIFVFCLFLCAIWLRSQIKIQQKTKKEAFLNFFKNRAGQVKRLFLSK